MADRHPIVVVDRETGTPFEEVVMGEAYIRWAYQDASSSILERVLFRSSVVSKLMGAWFDSRLSKPKIGKTIAQLDIDETEFLVPIEEFNSFNDFFSRRLKPSARPYTADAAKIVSPADGRVLVFPELDDATFAPVKGFPFSLHKMLPQISARYLGGALAVVRLCPADYHRYHFPCDGQITQSRAIDGALHSVNPIALASGHDVFGENKRHYTLIETEKAGLVCFVEVGAFGVGSIVNTKTEGTVRKMDEKGFFKFGGSTIVLVFEKGRIRFSDDLIANSALGRETLVKVGQDMADIVTE